MQPTTGALRDLQQPLLERNTHDRPPRQRRASTEASIQAFEAKRMQHVEKQKNAIIEAIASRTTHFTGLSLASLNLSDNAQLLTLSLAFISVHLLTGVMWFHLVVGWPMDDSLYFCVVTVTTVGFGDFVPDTKRDKLFTCVYLLFGLWVLGVSIGVVLSCLGEMARRRRPEDDEEATAAGGGAPAASMSGQLSDTIAGSGLRIVLWVGTGALFFGVVEGRDWVDAVYLTMVSLSTVGYGDLSPRTKLARLFCAAFLLVGTAVLGAELTFLAQLPIRLRRERLERRVLNQYGDRIDIEHLQDLCGPQMRTLRLGHPGATRCTKAGSSR